MSLAWSQSKSHRPSSAVSDHASLGPIAPTRSAKRLTLITFCSSSPLFARPRRLGVCPNVGPVEERHAEFDTARLSEIEQAFPHAESGPADERLRGHPPRPKLGGDGPPLGSVLVPPDDRLDGAAQVIELRPASRTTLVDQRKQDIPFHIRQNHPLTPI